MSTMQRHSKLFALAFLIAGGALLSGSFRLGAAEVQYLNTDVDTDSAKLEEYRDLDSGFRIALLRLMGESDDGERVIDFRAVNAPRDDARYTLSYGRPGSYGITLDYNRIPHNFGNNGRLLWTRTAAGRYEIPDDIQRRIQTEVGFNRQNLFFPFLNQLLVPYIANADEIDLGIQRNRATAAIDFGGLRSLSWGLQYTHENRTGTRPFGGSFGLFNATEIPEPIDHDTDQAELSGEWKGAAGGVRFGYRHSRFQNNIDTVRWDNPFRVNDSGDPLGILAPTPLSIGGSSTGIADLAPDNESNLLFLNGRGRLGAWWMNGSATYNRMEQDDELLAYTVNQGIRLVNDDGTPFDPRSTSTLPIQTAQRESTRMSLSAQAGRRFGKLWDLTFRYRLYDFDDESPRTEFPFYISFQASFVNRARITVPYAYRTQDATAELGRNLGASTHVAFSYTLRMVDREFREVDSSDENVFRLALDNRPTDRWNIQAHYEHGDRSIDGYNALAQLNNISGPALITTHPDMRKFDQAERTYDSLRVQTQWAATDAVNLSFGVSGRDESYDESLFGLISDELLEYNAEVSYSPGESFTFFLFGHRADRESFQRNRESGGSPSEDPEDDWSLDLDEVTDTWGLGVNTKFAKRWTSEVSAQWSRSDGFADFFSPPGGEPDLAEDFDDYDDVELLALFGRVDYQLGKHASAGLSYRWEEYDVESFLLRGLRNYMPGAILLNADNGDYTAEILGINVTVNF